MITVACVLGICLCGRDVGTGAIPPSLKETAGLYHSPFSRRLCQAFYLQVWWGEPSQETLQQYLLSHILHTSMQTHGS